MRDVGKWSKKQGRDQRIVTRKTFGVFLNDPRTAER